MTDISRRRLLAAAPALAAPALASAPAAALDIETPRGADDEAAWARIAAAYDMTTQFINLENGNWGVMARPVIEAYQRHTEKVNRENSYYARRNFHQDFVSIRARVAMLLGVSDAEIAFTRGATEALQKLIGNYRLLRAGDKVMMADLDYDSIQATLAAKAASVGAGVVMLDIPEPADHDGLIDFYERALDAHPETRLLLLTHISHRTGLCLPVREIAARAKARGVDVVVDAAHSWGQIDFTADDLGADFVGYNLHKWIGAPIGVGLLYIKQDRLDDIAPDISALDWEKDRIEGRAHTGTSNFAAMLAVNDALDFHLAVGPRQKEARLRYLRGLWAEEARRLPGIDILTPEDPRLHGGITSFRLHGAQSAEAAKEVANRLLDEFGIFTVHRPGVANGACVRVTPSLYNAPSDVERLAAALAAITA